MTTKHYRQPNIEEKQANLKEKQDELRSNSLNTYITELVQENNNLAFWLLVFRTTTILLAASNIYLACERYLPK